MEQRLSCILNYNIDLVNIRKVSTVLQKEIIKNGQIIINNDNKKRMYFELKVISNYVKLSEERSKVIRQFQDRGI
jgi:hypothetical protein